MTFDLSGSGASNVIGAQFQFARHKEIKSRAIDFCHLFYNLQYAAHVTLLGLIGLGKVLLHGLERKVRP